MRILVCSLALCVFATQMHAVLIDEHSLYQQHQVTLFEEAHRLSEEAKKRDAEQLEAMVLRLESEYASKPCTLFVEVPAQDIFASPKVTRKLFEKLHDAYLPNLIMRNAEIRGYISAALNMLGSQEYSGLFISRERIYLEKLSIAQVEQEFNQLKAKVLALMPQRVHDLDLLTKLFNQWKQELEGYAPGAVYLKEVVMRATREQCEGLEENLLYATNNLFDFNLFHNIIEAHDQGRDVVAIAGAHHTRKVYELLCERGFISRPHIKSRNEMLQAADINRKPKKDFWQKALYSSLLLTAGFVASRCVLSGLGSADVVVPQRGA